MKNLFTRISNAISADLHDMLDQKEKQNPVALLNQYLRQCEQETEKVRKLVERQYLLKDEFNREFNQAQQQADKRRRQAEIALQAGENDLYEFALSEQKQYEERAARLQESHLEAVRHLEELERKYEEMKHKLKDMQIRRMEVMGRENVARANHKISHVLNSGMEADRAYTKFEDMENYLERLEHQVNTAYHKHTLDARIAKLEKDMKNQVS